MTSLAVNGSPLADKRMDDRKDLEEMAVKAYGESAIDGRTGIERRMEDGIEMVGKELVRAMGMAGAVADETLGAKVNRRRLLRMAAGVSAAAVAGGVVKALPARAAGGSHYRTTSALNLRAKPSTSAKILLVIPDGAVVEDLGTAQNGFSNVKYQGTAGWAYTDYLESTNPDANVSYIGAYVTTSNVNFRTGPGTDYSVMWVVSKGTTVDATNQAFNGFRLVTIGGTNGWIYDAYLVNANSQGGASQTLTTTSNLNLRQQPSTGAKILLVIPKGAQVTAYDDSQNGFRWVSYNGTSGWAYEAYLA
jgi:uncharacterized protein YraI